MSHRNEGWPRRQMTVVCGLAAVTSLFMGVAVAEGLSALDTSAGSRQASPRLEPDRPPIVVPEMEFPTPALNPARPRPREESTPSPDDSDREQQSKRLHQVRSDKTWRLENGVVAPEPAKPDDDDCVLVPELGEVSRDWLEGLDPRLRERLLSARDVPDWDELTGRDESFPW